MTKPTMWLCAQRRLRSAWASAQSDQSLGMKKGWLVVLRLPSLIRVFVVCIGAWRKVGSLATHWTHSEGSDQTERMPRLIWVFVVRIVILLVLSWDGSFSSNNMLLYTKTADGRTALHSKAGSGTTVDWKQASSQPGCYSTKGKNAPLAKTLAFGY